MSESIVLSLRKQFDTMNAYVQFRACSINYCILLVYMYVFFYNFT